MGGGNRILSNAEIADRLASLAQLLSAQKENPYKIKAYQRAANSIRNLSDSVHELLQREADLTAYTGIGRATGDGIILKSGAVEPMDCLHYSLNLPISVLITGIDKKEILDQAFAAVKSFKARNQAEVAELISKTREAAMAGKYELLKRPRISIRQTPDWLGADSPAVQRLAPQLPG
jgi:DNA polymerase/3'-5' exonuclease PolX